MRTKHMKKEKSFFNMNDTVFHTLIFLGCVLYIAIHLIRSAMSPLIIAFALLAMFILNDVMVSRCDKFREVVAKPLLKELTNKDGDKILRRNKLSKNIVMFLYAITNIGIMMITAICI